MAEVIGIASGLVALTVFTYKSSVSLSKTIHSLKSKQRQIRNLQDELEALQDALKPLSEDLEDSSFSLEALKVPLLRCGRACIEFEVIISKCVERSSGSRTSFRDWAKLQYMGSDIEGFRNILSGYKSTINIALGGVMLRKVTVTAEVLSKYETLIENTTEDLRDHLEHISKQLEDIRARRPDPTSEDDTDDEQQILEERASTTVCLEVVREVADVLDRVRPRLVEQRLTRNGNSSRDVYIANIPSSSRDFTAQLLSPMHANVRSGLSALEARLNQLELKLRGITSSGRNSPLSSSAERDIEEQIDGIKQCLEICDDATVQANQARTNVFEDVRAGDDANQVVVSTLGDLVSAKRITAGARSTQLLGQMADETVQQLSKSKVSDETTAGAEEKGQ